MDNPINNLIDLEINYYFTIKVILFVTWVCRSQLVQLRLSRVDHHDSRYHNAQKTMAVINDNVPDFGPGGNDDGCYSTTASKRRRAGIRLPMARLRRQDVYFTDPSVENSIRLCGNRHSERQRIYRFSLTGGRQTDGGIGNG